MRKPSSAMLRRLEEAEAAVSAKWLDQVGECLIDTVLAAPRSDARAVMLRLVELSASGEIARCRSAAHAVVIVLRAVREIYPDVADVVMHRFGIELWP
jgi:hypothetical protein